MSLEDFRMIETSARQKAVKELSLEFYKTFVNCLTFTMLRRFGEPISKQVVFDDAMKRWQNHVSEVIAQYLWDNQVQGLVREAAKDIEEKIRREYSEAIQ